MGAMIWSEGSSSQLHVVDAAKFSSSSSSSGSYDSKTLQRIKKEYRTIIQDKIAYDWLKQERIIHKSTNKTKKKKTKIKEI